MDDDRINQLEDQRHQEVLTAVRGVHDRLDSLNGRTRTLEQQLGVLQWAYAAGSAVIAYIIYKITPAP